MINNVKITVDECKHSVILLMQYAGGYNTHCNMILLKWPDLFDAFISDDEIKFNEDAAVLICLPLKIIAESLFQACQMFDSIDNKVSEDINEVMLMHKKDPIEAKASLIAICNSLISKLRKIGWQIDYIKWR